MSSKYPEPKRFKPNNIQKYAGDPSKITSRSSWETKLMRWLDKSPAVIKWGSENVVIPYYSSSDQKHRRYYMDFYAYYHIGDGKCRKVLIEVKPYSQTVQPRRGGRKKLETFLNESKTWQVNKDKWQAADKYAKARGWQFIILTEYELFNDKYVKGRPAERTRK
mgnify:CR=1 FL=1